VVGRGGVGGARERRWVCTCRGVAWGGAVASCLPLALIEKKIYRKGEPSADPRLLRFQRKKMLNQALAHAHEGKRAS